MSMNVNVRGMINRIQNRLEREQYYRKIETRLKEKSPKIILIGTPEHGNLGDHAIAEAELDYFRDHYSSIEVVEITGQHYRHRSDKIKNKVKKDDIVCITGGGFLGDLWMIEEEMVRNIIQTFDENRMYIFPSTIHFRDDENGQKELDKSIDIYSKHKDLHIVLRDQASISVAHMLLGEHADDRIIHTPDIVLYMNKTEQEHRRSGLLLCFRDDKEKILIAEDEHKIKRLADKLGTRCHYTNTVVPINIRIDERAVALEKKYDEFRSAQMVITDRLHGMIFSAITGTPCIALNNLSGKVKGVYAWISHLPYVVCVDSINDIENLMEPMMKLGTQVYDEKSMRVKYSGIDVLGYGSYAR